MPLRLGSPDSKPSPVTSWGTKRSSNSQVTVVPAGTWMAGGVNLLSLAATLVTPVTGALLNRIAGVDVTTYTKLLMIGLPVLTAMALGAYVLRSRRDPFAYLLMALVMGIGVLGTLMAPEPPLRGRGPSFVEAVAMPFGDFFRRAGRNALPILAFIVLFKLGDAALNNMATPFLLKAGFTPSPAIARSTS